MEVGNFGLYFFDISDAEPEDDDVLSKRFTKPVSEVNNLIRVVALLICKQYLYIYGAAC